MAGDFRDSLISRESRKLDELQSSALLHRINDLKKDCEVPLEIIMSDCELRIKYFMCFEFELRSIGYSDFNESNDIERLSLIHI